MLISLKLQANINFMQRTSLDHVDFRSFTDSWHFWLHIIVPPKDLHLENREKFISRNM